MASQLGQDDPSRPVSKGNHSIKSLVKDLDLSVSEKSTRDALLQIKHEYSKKLENVESLVAAGGLEQLLLLLGGAKAIDLADNALSIIANCLTFAAARREFYRLEGVAKVVPWLEYEASTCGLLARGFRCLSNLVEGNSTEETSRLSEKAAFSVVGSSVIARATCNTVNKHAGHRRCIFAALRVLCQLASSSSSRKIVLESKVFALSIKKILKCKTPEVLQCALTCIQLFAAHDVSFSAQLATAGAVETVVVLAEDNQAKIRQRAVLSLVHCVKESACQQIVSRSGGLRILLSHFQSSSRTSRRCLALLKALVTCCRSAECRSRAHSDGLLQAFIEVLDDTRSAELHGYIMHGLAAFYFDDVGLRLMVKQHGQRLLQVLTRRLRGVVCGNTSPVHVTADSSKVAEDNESKSTGNSNSVGGSFTGDKVLRDGQPVDGSLCGLPGKEKDVMENSGCHGKETDMVLDDYVCSLNAAETFPGEKHVGCGDLLEGSVGGSTFAAPLEIQSEMMCVEKSPVHAPVKVEHASAGLKTHFESVCNSAVELINETDDVHEVNERSSYPKEAPSPFCFDGEVSDCAVSSSSTKMSGSVSPYAPSPLFGSSKGSGYSWPESPAQASPARMSPPPMSPPPMLGPMSPLSPPVMSGAMSPRSMSPPPLNVLCPSPPMSSPSMSPCSIPDYSTSPPLSPDVSSPPTPQPITIPVPTMDFPPSRHAAGEFPVRKDMANCSSSEVALLSRFSQLHDCLPYLATDYILTALVERLCSWPADAARCFRIIQRLVRDASCLRSLMVHRSPAILYHLCAEEAPKEAAEAGCHLLDDLSHLVESPYGYGTLAHILLKGSSTERSSCLISLLYVCRSYQRRRSLFIHHGGLDLLVEMLTTMSRDNDQWNDLTAGLAVFLSYHNSSQQRINASWPGNASPVYATSLKRQHIADDSILVSALPESSVGDVDCCDSKQCFYLLAGKQQDWDVTFLLPDGVCIPAHRNRLAACSEVLNAMLLGSFAEARMQDAIPIHGVHSSAFGGMVHCAYGCPVNCVECTGKSCPRQPRTRSNEDADGGHDTASPLNLWGDSFVCAKGKSPCWPTDKHNGELCNLLQLIICADRYLMVDLRNQCALLIGKHLVAGNVVFVYDLSRCYSDDSLMRRCLEFLVTLGMPDLSQVVTKLLDRDAVKFVEDIFKFLNASWQESATRKKA